MNAIVDLTAGDTSGSESDNESDNDSVVIQLLPAIVAVAAVARFINGTLWGNPQPFQQRRLAPNGRYYNPGAQQKVLAVQHLRQNRINVNDHSGPLPGPLSVIFTFYFRATHQHQCGQPYTRTPDADNLAKFMLDAMADAGFYQNDSFVFSMRITKEYCPSLDFNQPRTIYRVHQRIQGNMY